MPELTERPKSTRTLIAEEHDRISAALKPEDLARAERFEKLLCGIFKKQFALGSIQCLELRKTIIDFITEQGR